MPIRCAVCRTNDMKEPKRVSPATPRRILTVARRGRGVIVSSSHNHAASESERCRRRHRRPPSRARARIRGATSPEREARSSRCGAERWIRRAATVRARKGKRQLADPDKEGDRSSAAAKRKIRRGRVYAAKSQSGGNYTGVSVSLFYCRVPGGNFVKRGLLISF